MRLAFWSLPQMNIVGGPPFSTGFTMSAFPTELNAFTNRAEGYSRCSRSISESSRGAKPKRPMVRRGIGDWICRVDDDLAVEIRRARQAQRRGRSRSLHGKDEDLAG